MTTPPTSVPRAAFLDGLRDLAPLNLGTVPFGLIVGVAAASSRMGALAGWSTSPIIFGGSAQVVTIDLYDTGAAAIVIIATALVVNARHVMYSAVLAPWFRPFPNVWRYGLAYLMTDQLFATAVTRWQGNDDSTYHRWYFLGGGLCLWLPWQMASAAGAVLGAQVPAEWSLDFAIPMVFLVLLIMAVHDRPGVVAAVVGGGVALAARDVALNLGLVAATIAGIVAGLLAERWR
jgi:predicted branched-subunit amino acid permease